MESEDFYYLRLLSNEISNDYDFGNLIRSYVNRRYLDLPGYTFTEFYLEYKKQK